MRKRTPLYACHIEAGAKMVDFAGWDMPLHYGSQIEEHHAVRNDVGLFDVSHMSIVDIEGIEATAYLRLLLANNIDKLIVGKALYSCMLNESGGILDDLIAYKISDTYYRLVLNSATREKDLAWMQQQAKLFKIVLSSRLDLAILAVQGPAVSAKMAAWLKDAAASGLLSKRFHFTVANVGGKSLFIARTGYTGEDGYELIVPAADAHHYWQQWLSLNAIPCGLGARDTLRLEAGLNLYGIDMDETVTPYESNLGWTVALEPKDRQFIGREVLEQQQQKGIQQQLVGLILLEQGVLRNQLKVLVEGEGVGEVTSGSFSPTLGKGIGLARIPTTNLQQCLVEVRGKKLPATIIKPPFVRSENKMTKGVTV